MSGARPFGSSPRTRSSSPSPSSPSPPSSPRTRWWCLCRCERVKRWRLGDVWRPPEAESHNCCTQSSDNRPHHHHHHNPYNNTKLILLLILLIFYIAYENATQKIKLNETEQKAVKGLNCFMSVHLQSNPKNFAMVRRLKWSGRVLSCDLS